MPQDLSAFHPDLRTVARFVPRLPITARSRRFVQVGFGLLGRTRPKGVEICPVGQVTVRLHRPPAGDPSGTGTPGDRHPGVLWVHGGGMVIGSAAQDDALCRRLAKRHGAVVAAVDYRLAPEHPFPAPLDDCHDALVWLASQPDVDPNRIVIAGASAGGGLTAGLALLAQDRGDVRPAFQVLVYPMIDDRTVLRHDLDERNFRMWTNRSNRYGWSSYLGCAPGSPDMSAYAAPARATDNQLAQLPPAWIGVGSLDLFHDEDVLYAERLRSVGVDCELNVVPGAFHAFDGLARKAPVTRGFNASRDAAIAAALVD